MGNAEALNFTLQPDDEQAKRNFFSRFFSSDNHQQGIYQAMNEEQFSQLMGAINKTSERLDELEKTSRSSARRMPRKIPVITSRKAAPAIRGRTTQNRTTRTTKPSR